MLLKVFSLYDAAVEAYSRPICVRTTGEALRMFEDLVNDNNTAVGRYPTQHSLVEIGTFDDGVGRMYALDHFNVIANGIEYVKAYKHQDVKQESSNA